MSFNRATISSTKRSVDAESRKPKLNFKKKSTLRVPAPVIESASDPDSVTEESEVEKDLDVGVKSTSFIPTAAKKVKERRQPRKVVEADDIPASTEKEEGDHVSPAMLLMLGSSLNISGSRIKYPAVSGYIPDFHSFYHSLEHMQTLCFNNEYMRRLDPSYYSLTTSIYYGVLSMFQIARTRNQLGIASRSESNFARRFEREFPLESLSIAGPLAGFFEVLGSLTPLEDYGPLAPDFPNFSAFNQVGNFNSNPHGIARLPALPAMIKLWRDIATNTNMRPNAHILLYWTSASSPKVGIDFGNANQYSRLAFSPGWTEPLAPLSHQNDFATLRTHLRRMVSPPNPDQITFDGVANFCGLTDNISWLWFKGFARTAATEASFFKGATNMSKISTIATPAFIVEPQTSLSWTPRVYTAAANPDAPFFEQSAMPTGNELSVLQKVGSETDFRIGAASSFCLHYQQINDDSLRRRRIGPWYNERVSDVTIGADNMSSSVPFIKEEWNTTNPAQSFGDVIRMELFLPKGKDQ